MVMTSTIAIGIVMTIWGDRLLQRHSVESLKKSDQFFFNI